MTDIILYTKNHNLDQVFQRYYTIRPLIEQEYKLYVATRPYDLLDVLAVSERYPDITIILCEPPIKNHETVFEAYNKSIFHKYSKTCIYMLWDENEIDILNLANCINSSTSNKNIHIYK